MEYADVINQLTQESGVQLENPNDFVPESKEHSDIYFALNDEEKEETLLNLDYPLRIVQVVNISVV